MTLRTGSWLCAIVAVAATVAVPAHAQSNDRVRAALQAPERSAQDKARDERDKPLEVLEFLGLESGMTALDVSAGAGYWTEVMSAVVGPEGKVYMQNGQFMLNREGFAEQERAKVDRLGNVEPLHGDLAEIAPEGEVDVALTSMNFHDIYNRGGQQAGVAFLRGVHTALKPGGVLGVIDHVGIEGQDNAEFHRVTPEDTRAALEAAGFVVEDESDLLENPDDPHTVNIRDPSLDGVSDKFLILARKPR